MKNTIYPKKIEKHKILTCKNTICLAIEVHTECGKYLLSEIKTFSLKLEKR